GSSLDLDQYEPGNLAYVFPLCCSNSEVEQCQQESCVLNAMARGQLPALSVMALAAGASPGSWSVFAGNAMEAANVAATFAAVQQKLSPRANDGQLSSTPADENSASFAERE